ncbi:MAG: GNAT family N-acetyltransferase [Clostridiales bacterium]|nr:GNAT family N-acetyltransferase [Clostridiales bacterium]
MLNPFAKQDFDGLYAFMRPIWHETYGEILPPTQIDFLLEKYFSAQSLQAYLAQGYEYFKIDNVGVLVIVERENEIYLDKLYLLPTDRGKGYPQRVFSELLKRGKDILLNVNKGNQRAVSCYKKNGFFIEETVDIDLGDGMVNQDYVMRKRQEK